MYLLIVSLTKKSSWNVENPILNPNWLSSDFIRLGVNLSITRSNIWAKQFEIETARKLLISKTFFLLSMVIGLMVLQLNSFVIKPEHIIALINDLIRYTKEFDLKFLIRF